MVVRSVLMVIFYNYLKNPFHTGCLLAVMLCAVWLSSCQRKQEVVITGPTMGTTYSVKVVTHRNLDTAALKAKIDRRLVDINQSMSTYLPDSEISRFNRWRDTEKEFEISDDFKSVMMTGARLFRLTQGAWDATVDPLIVLWGFGRQQQTNRIPSADEIQEKLRQIGFDHIRLSEKGAITKLKPAITLDLASIAKGYGVDQIARLLHEDGFTDFLVEIGGEVYAAGRRKDGAAWKIGINTPLKDAAPNQVYKVVKLQNKAFATSGDYRIFFEAAGKRYSHVIDPRTGYPVDNGVVSVSIVADNCTFADGLATAVMVAGVNKGMALIDSLKGVEGLIVVKDTGGELTDYYSQNMEAYF